MNVLAERAMLSHVKISAWTARRIDRKATDEVNENNGAANDAGRYNKLLIDKSALAPVSFAANHARTFHYSRTLPWQDEGARLLPAAAFVDYTAQLRAMKGTFEKAVAEFLAAYPAAIDATQKRLGGLFRQEEYPSADDIARRFAFDIVVNPVPVGADFRVDLGNGQAEIIRQEIEARAQSQLQEAMRDVYRRIAENCTRMVDRLNAYQPGSDGERAQGVFRDSLVENVRDLASILPSLNITADPHLAAIAARVQKELTRHDADELRESETARETVAKSAAAILADVSDFLA
jgi:hypothetical protein